MFNPLQHRYPAHFVGEENGDIFLQLQHVGQNHVVRFPKALLPKEFDYHQSFQVGLFPQQNGDGGDLATMKELLQELIK